MTCIRLVVVYKHMRNVQQYGPSRAYSPDERRPFLSERDRGWHRENYNEYEWRYESDRPPASHRMEYAHTYPQKRQRRARTPEPRREGASCAMQTIGALCALFAIMAVAGVIVEYLLLSGTIGVGGDGAPTTTTILSAAAVFQPPPPPPSPPIGTQSTGIDADAALLSDDRTGSRPEPPSPSGCTVACADGRPCDDDGGCEEGSGTDPNRENGSGAYV